MNALLASSAALAVLLAVLHSVLGERYVVRRMLRREQPKLFGSDDFTKRTLRFQWHLLTVAWLGLAALLVWVPASALFVAATMGASAALTVVLSKGRHLSWVVMVASADLAWLGAA